MEDGPPATGMSLPSSPSKGGGDAFAGFDNRSEADASSANTPNTLSTGRRPAAGTGAVQGRQPLSGGPGPQSEDTDAVVA